MNESSLEQPACGQCAPETYYPADALGMMQMERDELLRQLAAERESKAKLLALHQKTQAWHAEAVVFITKMVDECACPAIQSHPRCLNCMARDFLSSTEPPALLKEVSDLRKLNKQHCAEWANDHTRLQEMVKTVLPLADVVGNSCGVPGILDLAEMLLKEVERLRGKTHE